MNLSRTRFYALRLLKSPRIYPISSAPCLKFCSRITASKERTQKQQIENETSNKIIYDPGSIKSCHMQIIFNFFGGFGSLLLEFFFSYQKCINNWVVLYYRVRQVKQVNFALTLCLGAMVEYFAIQSGTCSIKALKERKRFALCVFDLMNFDCCGILFYFYWWIEGFKGKTLDFIN